jgi:hypothetical protein
MSGAVARAGWPLAVPSVGLTKMGRTKTEKISHDAGILFFQRKEFFARSQAAFHFHGASLAYSPVKFKADVDGFRPTLNVGMESEIHLNINASGLLIINSG